jgi:IclR family pca regulon transcriptional regulator
MTKVTARRRERGATPRTAGHYSSSLARGLAVLGSFTPSRSLLGISELARLLDMNSATVHRYVRTLEHLGYLSQDRSTRRYRLAAKVMDLGLASVNSMALREIAGQQLKDLSEHSGQSVSLAVLDDLEIVYIERVLAPMALNVNLHVGSRLPAYCTSLGKALLAFLPEEERTARLRRIEFLKRGPNSITSRRALQQDLLRVRERGYATNDEELEHGIRSVSAPIHSASGLGVAAINLAVHASRFTMPQLVSKHLPSLITTARDVSRQLGYRGVG